VPEREVGRLPEILGDYHARADEMGRRAREEWEKYYAPSARSDWLVEDCLVLRRARRVPEAITGRIAWWQLFHYRTFRLNLNSKQAIYRETGGIILWKTRLHHGQAIKVATSDCLIDQQRREIRWSRSPVALGLWNWICSECG